MSDIKISNTVINPVSKTKPRSSATRGLIFMAVGMFLFSAGDMLAKYLTADFHAVQIMWSRQAGLMGGVVILIAFRGLSVFRSTHPRLQITRGAAAAGSGTIFIFAVAYVPLADAVAVSFVAPFMVTIMGALFLGEKVGIRRWTAVIIGFLGTLVVIRPSADAVHPAVFLVLIAAGLFATRQILSRALSDDKTTTTIAYTALVSGAILSAALPFVWKTPQTGQAVLIFVGLAIIAAAAEICIIKALEFTEAVIVAPVHYSLIIWGTMYGYVIFNDLPDIWTWVGAAIISTSGIYTLYREHHLSKQASGTE
jgi:S-adenosylmethionine uptake transporter